MPVQNTKTKSPLQTSSSATFNAQTCSKRRAEKLNNLLYAKNVSSRLNGYNLGAELDFDHTTVSIVPTKIFWIVQTILRRSNGLDSLNHHRAASCD
jgi:hypothetical protein